MTPGLLIFLKGAAVVLIIVGMIVILLGINHYGPAGRQTLDDRDTDKLRHDVENKQEVITRHNLFHQFLSPSSDRVKQKNVRHYNSPRK